MTTLIFNRSTGQLFFNSPSGQAVFPAANFVDSHSNGAWPSGQFPFDHATRSGDTEEGPYGSVGVVFFQVPNRMGMGLHAGRKTTPDALGRTGICHATQGCIRTTEAAMKELCARHLKDPITSLVVI